MVSQDLVVFGALLNEISTRNLSPKELQTLRWKFEEIENF